MKKIKKRKVKKNSNRNNTPNYFGMEKSPSYLGGKSNISFFSSKSKPLKRVKQRKPKTKPVNFLTQGKVMPKQKHINWNYKRIKKKFPNMNPYGDADMDGSMNYKDCKPFDASRDGFFARALSIVTGGRKGQTKEDYAQERSRKKEFKVYRKKEPRRIYSKEGTTQKKIKREKVSRLFKAISKSQTKIYPEHISSNGAQKLIEESVGEKVDMGKIAKVLAAEKLAKKIAKRKDFAETGAGVRALTRKVLYKKVPIKSKKTGKITGYKTVLRGGKPVSKKALKAVALTGIPVKIPKDKKDKAGKTYAHAGRPKGPSGKYVIPGKGPVYEHEYKKWLTKQRALARIKAEQARGIPQEDVSETPVADEVLEEYGPEEVEEPEPAPQPQQLTPEQIQRIRQLRLARQQQTQQAQQTQQRPSQTVGGPVQDHILNAPNIARGELRASQSGVQIQSTNLGARPQVNPRGEYYTNIDPMTGKPIMQRRVSEKFATVGDGDL